MVAPPPHDDAVLSLVFPVAAGLQAGLTASQLRGPRFDAPQHGLRHAAGGQPSLAGVVRALQRTNPGTAATHATAARLWGMWLPRQWERGPIHLARTRAEGGAPRRSGVVGHELHPQDPVLVRAGCGSRRRPPPGRRWRSWVCRWPTSSPPGTACCNGLTARRAGVARRASAVHRA